MKAVRAKITALGMYVPERRVTNDELSKLVDTSDEWIRARTGIAERRIVSDSQANSDLSIKAIKNAFQARELRPEEIDLIIVATVTPDMMFPSTACIIQDKIGAKNAWGFDLLGACSGFLYAIATGAQFVQTGAYKRVLVIGTDVMSSILNFEDRTTCVLFGDGAGAVLLEPSQEDDTGIIDFILHSDGSGGKFLYMPAGGSLHPASHETVDKKMHYVHQDGRNVFKFAVKLMTEVSLEILQRNGYTTEDVTLYIPHQANLRIIQSSVERLKLRPEQVVINIDRYANTTAATIPVGLAEAYHQGRMKKGDLMLLVSFGAGFTWGSLLLRWGDLG
ncbi:ketoacyl-ACP synthase III [Acidobacteria bacterium AH-259-G07]|nr:ketoacyl-ACP synthase III [Acidobacteria bacterium AH-259-G07]